MLNARSRVLIMLAISLVCAQSSDAVPITFRFEGEVPIFWPAPTGVWAGQGSTVSGYYTLDTALRSSPDESNNWFRGDSIIISVTVGAVTRSTTGPGSLILADWYAVDRYEVSSGFSGAEWAWIRLQDFTPSPPDGVAPGNGNLTGEIPTWAPRVELFDNMKNVHYEAVDAAGNPAGTIEFRLSRIWRVPEPFPATLLVGGLALLAIRRRRSI